MEGVGMEISVIGVVGAGQMGNGIAHVMALAGYNVLLNDINADALEKAVSLIDKNLARQVSRGKITEEEMAAAMARISTTLKLADLGKTEPEPDEFIGNLGILVVARRHAHRVGEVQSGDGDRKPRIVIGAAAWHQSALERADRNSVRGFGVEREQRAPGKSVNQAHHDSMSGNTCAPSGPSGSGLTHLTAESGISA